MRMFTLAKLFTVFMLTIATCRAALADPVDSKDVHLAREIDAARARLEKFADLDQSARRLEQESRDLGVRIKIYNDGHGAPAEADALEAAQKDLQTRCHGWERRDSERKQVLGQVIDLERQRIGVLQKIIAADAEMIGRLGFASQEADFKAWNQLAEKARNEARAAVRDAVVSHALEALKIGAESVALVPSAAKKCIEMLKAAGVENKGVFEALETLSMLDPMDAAKAAVWTRHLVTNLGIAWDEVRVTKDLDDAKTPEEKRQAALNGLATILGFAIKSPQLTLLLSDLQFTVGQVYDNATRRVALAQIEKLTRLNESDLVILRNRSQRMKSHVDALAALRNALATDEKRLTP